MRVYAVTPGMPKATWNVMQKCDTQYWPSFAKASEEGRHVNVILPSFLHLPDDDMGRGDVCLDCVLHVVPPPVDDEADQHSWNHRVLLAPISGA